MPKKLDMASIKMWFEKNDYVLKSTHYVSAHTKLDYICPEGHEHSMSWNNFQQGKRCPTCADNSRSTIQSHDIPHIRKQFEKRGWLLKSSVYVNGYTDLEYVCDKGHKGSISWTHFQQGIGCSTCFAIRMSGENNPNWKGGYVRKPYCDAWYDVAYKVDIKKRDSYRCQNPYCSCNGGVLCLHHIDYNPMNCNPNNLITLCRGCHGMSNANREWHKLYFQTLMNHKYGYIY